MFAVNLGIKAIAKHRLENGISLTPSLHASVDMNLMNKAQKVRAQYVYTSEVLNATASTGVKAPKVSYNIGGGLVVQKNSIEVSANYNLNMAKKYIAHQGSLKLKVMF